VISSPNSMDVVICFIAGGFIVAVQSPAASIVSRSADAVIVALKIS